MSDKQKKHQLLQILEKLSPVWENALGIMALLEYLEYEEKYVEALLQILQDAMKTVSDGQSKKKMQEWIKHLKDIQKEEGQERNKEKVEVQDIFSQESW